MKLVLIVEDEYGIAESLRMLLEAHDYRVASAYNGKEALDLLAGEKPALILSDFMMPHMNGAELGRAVRQNPSLRDTPFVFMSATSEAVIQRSFRDYDAFLPKPYGVDAVLVLLNILVTGGRPAAARNAEAHQSVRQLLKGIELPPGD